LDKYINNGSGHFTRTQIISNGVYDSCVALGDIDNDGDLDLVVGGYDDSRSRLEIYTNNGAGGFQLKSSLKGTRNGAVALGDIDNDNDLDLIVAYPSPSWSNGLRKYTNNGSGDLIDAGRIAGFDFCSKGGASIALGDIDNDGDLDLTAAGNSEHIVLKNDGTGRFLFSQSLVGIKKASIALGDIDNDGDLDLVISGRSPAQRLAYYLNDGNGNFGTISSNLARPLAYDWWSVIALGDLDNDGDLDLLAAGTSHAWGLQFDMYTNSEPTINASPNIPFNTSSTSIGGYWRFKWTAPTDDHTPSSVLRYKIAIGIGSSGVYNYSSANIDYPRGQANIGNVCIVTGCFYQSKIPDTETVYWKVGAIDTSFKFSGYSPESIASLIPTPPNLLKPVDGTITNNNTPTFVWNASFDTDGIANYRIVIDTITNIAVGTNYTPAVGLTDGSHIWKVQAKDNVGKYGNFSTNWSIIIDTTVPTPPSLISPINGAIIYNNNPIFVWGKSTDTGTGIKNYTVLISRDNFASIQHSYTTSNKNQTNWSGVPPLNDGIWQWKVIASDKAGNKSASPINTFMINGVTIEDILVTDGIHTISIPPNSTDTSQRIANNIPITITTKINGITPNCNVFLIYGIDTQPLDGNKIQASWDNDKWVANISSDIIEGKNDKILYFQFIVEGYLIENKNLGASYNSWGFTLAEIKRQANNFTVINNVIKKGSDTPISIIYSIKKSVRVNICVYNINGELVKEIIDELQGPGSYLLQWYGKNIRNSDVGRGIYFIIGHLGNITEVRKVMIK